MPRPNRDLLGRTSGVAVRKRGAPEQAASGIVGRGGLTEARLAAASICADLRAGVLLDVSFDSRAGKLDARDRRWTRTLIYGMLRRRFRVDAALDACVSGGIGRLDADVLDVLRLGAYQLLFMNAVPPYAAIAQTVELSKVRYGIGASKLTNAVLRRVDRERDQSGGEPLAGENGDQATSLALEYSHPRWLVARWMERWPLDEVRSLLAANNEEAPLVARPFNVVREQLEAIFEGAGLHVRESPLVKDSLVFDGADASFTELGAFQQGLFHVQDPASTLVARYVSAPPGSVVADLCAAPGGKSAELSRTASRVFASDVSAERVARVRENIARLDLSNVSAYVADARAPACGPVDVALVDVPCTGTGTFRRHPDARWRLKPSDLATLARRQDEILRAASEIVRPGGILVYATCSLEPEENDQRVDAFLIDHPG
ncbi:MAG TPA: transcription antitermination factor NusB, partial [Gemmatimonadaceae bacterium]|nr:transcription antitermination factor NusB [Gemmatimonadaceae bacterium]